MTCGGSKVEQWALMAVKAAESEQIVGAGHLRAMSGDVVWCRVCGCYSDSRVRGLTDYCKGKPSDKSGGGRAGQLLYLRNNIHPRIRKALPAPVDEHGLELDGKHRYAELERRGNRGKGDVSSHWCSEGMPEASARTIDDEVTQHVGKSAAEKHRERLERVQAKETASKSDDVARRLRGKQRPGTAQQVQPTEVCLTWHGMW